MADVSFGDWVRRQRRASELTQEDVAAAVGCATITLRKIESDERRPSVDLAGQIARFFAVPEAEWPAFIRFARGDWTAPRSALPGGGPWRLSEAAPARMPAPTTRLIGREREIAEVRGRLAEPAVRLVTVLGPPGIGKTSLALESVRMPLEAFSASSFVGLSSLDDGALIPSAIAQSLGYVEAKGASPRAQLIRGIGDTRLLLVLDNCEHVIEDAASVAAELLSACPGLKILATSRELLRIPGEWVFSLRPLATPRSAASLQPDAVLDYPALALFVERSRAVRADFELNTGNLAAVAAICARLDGLPLAIELIAARMRAMSPQALLDRMSGSFLLSADGMRTAVVRHRTLGAAIRWSYEFLSPDEQRVFAWLSVFPASFTLEMAEAVCLPFAGDRSVADLVTLLLDKSLVQRSRDACGEDRFCFLATVREFGLERLRQSGDEAIARNRHLGCFQELAEEVDLHARGLAQAEWIERIEGELDHVRAALEWAVSSNQAGPALRLLVALAWPWEVRAHYNEAFMWLDRIVALPEAAAHPELLARALNHLGRYHWTLGQTAEARVKLDAALALSQSLGESGELILAESLNWLGLLLFFDERDRADGIAALEMGLRLFEEQGHAWGVALNTFHLGIVATAQGDYALAATRLEQSLASFEAFGDIFFIARVNIHLGIVALEQGHFDDAERRFGRHLELDEKLKFWNGIIDAWVDFNELYRRQGYIERAQACLEQGIEVARAHNPERKDLDRIARDYGLQPGTASSSTT